jgi:hypothetical protein
MSLGMSAWEVVMQVGMATAVVGVLLPMVLAGVAVMAMATAVVGVGIGLALVIMAILQERITHLP